MNEKRVIWTVVAGTAMLTVWRAVRTTTDPTPQLAGIGATGVMLLFMAEVAPKLASGFAVLFGLAYALAWEPTEIETEPVGDSAGMREAFGQNFPRSGRGSRTE